MRAGKVYIVGAGPGDPRLLTIRALEVIKGADVVFHDRLVSKAIIGLIPNGVRRIYAGKMPGYEESVQRRLNQLVLKEAKLGHRVVRLKGGDPLLFSRGGEEIEFLKGRGIQIEVVPGVTSAFAAPAYAGIPLTHRDHSSSVAIVTGHQVMAKKKNAGPRWSDLARGVDTLIILMGVAKLSEICGRLIQAGLAPSVPVAAIEWGTTQRQKTLLFTLKEAASGYYGGKVEPPSVVVVGKVVSLAPALRWYPREQVRVSAGYRLSIAKTKKHGRPRSR